MAESNSNKIEEFHQQILQELQESERGLSTDEIAQKTPTLTPGELVVLINQLTGTGNIQLLQGSTCAILRYRKSNLPADSTREQKLIYSLIEDAGEKGITVFDMRAQSGIAEPIIKKLLKEFEQRKLVKSMKAIGMNKKSYILFNLKAGDNLTGGTFYSHGELDSDFVQALIDFCVDMLQKRKVEAEEKFPYDARAQLELASANIESIAQYIQEKGVSKVDLKLSEVEQLLNVAMVDGKIVKQINNTYRATDQSNFLTPLTSMPCFTCPMREECCPGHRISPENCEYIKSVFDL